MTSDRLERAVQSMHNLTMTLTTIVVAAIGADHASSSFDLGGLSHALLYAALTCFVISAFAGGHLVTALPLMEGEVEDVMRRRAPIAGRTDRGFLPLRVAAWRGVQHWGLLAAITLALLGGLAVATAEDLVAPPQTAAPAPAR